MKQLACFVFLASLGLIWAKNSLIIDTDAGGDDAMAIVIALNNDKGYDIKGITTVKGNTEVDLVTMNVLKTLDVTGFLGEVDVYKGSASALVRDRENTYFFGRDGFGDFDYGKTINASEYVNETSAAEFLADIVKKNPEEITILCLGPLTNIALASRLNPKFFTEVKQILISGGSITGIGTMGKYGNSEYNMYMDPEAAMAVFDQIPDEKPVVLVPFDSLVRTPVPMSFRVETLGTIKTDIMRFLNKAEQNGLTGTEWMCYDQIVGSLINNWDMALTFIVGTPVIDSDGVMIAAPGNNVAFVTEFNSSAVQKDILSYMNTAT